MLLSLLACCPVIVCAQSVSWSSPARLTHMGPDLDRNFDARESGIAFNATNNEYLVVWEGTDQRPGIAPGEVEIYGQRVAAESGALLGKVAFRISFQGPDGTPAFDARNPAVTYNPVHNEYLVVWSGDDDRAPLVEGEFEIFGQRINAADGSLVGTQNFRISDMGPNGNRNYDATDPAVSYNVQDDLYLVVWRGEDGTVALPNGQFEIYGQLLDGASGQAVGNNDFRISRMGPDGNREFDAYSPALVYNATDNEFLLVWHGDDNRAPLVNDELEVFAQRLEAGTGVLAGPTPIRVSDAGADGDISREAGQPAVAWNRDTNEYLVVWSADDTRGGRPDGEFEIYGQMLTATGAETGENDFLVSNSGAVGDVRFGADEPAIAYHGAAHQFVVTWRGDDGIDGEFEIYSQRLDGPTRTPVGIPGQRLTHAGPDDSLLYDARRVSMTEDMTSGKIYLAWEQEDQTIDQVEGEFELYSSTLGASEFKLTEGISASWFDPAHDGEGWVVELIDSSRAAVYWFTYDPDVPIQAWMLGVGSVIDNRIVMTDVVIPTGGVFGPAFDPDTVQFDQWGSFVLEFDNCNSAGMNHNSSVGNFGAASLSPVRLTTLAGLDCPGPATMTDALAGISGSWYDPSHNGEGWVLEYLGDNRLLMYWFTYDNTGKQSWFIGIGLVSANEVVFDDVLITSGTRFGENFDSKAIVFDHWGTVDLTLHGCDTMTVDYASDDARYGSGRLEAQRLIFVAGMPCNLAQ